MRSRGQAAYETEGCLAPWGDLRHPHQESGHHGGAVADIQVGLPVGRSAGDAAASWGEPGIAGRARGSCIKYTVHCPRGSCDLRGLFALPGSGLMEAARSEAERADTPRSMSR